jgi:hypothetical protein
MAMVVKIKPESDSFAIWRLINMISKKTASTSLLEALLG